MTVNDAGFILFRVLNTNSNDLFLLPVDQVSRSYFILFILNF